MSRCPLFVELCAGSAAVTLGLLGGKNARPPVSYQGSKQGYRHAVLWALGLRLGQGADAVLLNDPGPWSRVWRVLVDPDGCKAVASIIRGWIGEDARKLWERLRAEPVPEDEGEAAARWVTLQRWAICGKNVTEERGHFISPGFSATDAYGKEPTEHFHAVPPQLPPTPGRILAAGSLRFPPDVDQPCRSIDRYHWPRTAVSNLDAADIHPEPPLPEGTVVLLDPPYYGDGSRKITGYAHKFPRAAVVEVAQRWKAAGARVAVCESVPVPELVEAGWHTVDITTERVGQRRTFSAESQEHLTLSHPPAWVPAVQDDLFAEATA